MAARLESVIYVVWNIYGLGLGKIHQGHQVILMCRHFGVPLLHVASTVICLNNTSGPFTNA